MFRDGVNPLRYADWCQHHEFGRTPSHIPDRREAILGGCGENVLFSTLRRMTGSPSYPRWATFVAPMVCTPRQMSSRVHLESWRDDHGLPSWHCRARVERLAHGWRDSIEACCNTYGRIDGF
jgi:hypothetical protein